MQKVRIIAGSLKGRNIIFPNEPGLRPTLGRVRETGFAWLEPYLWGARCLDLFAGSGAMGFEAISRGARDVVMLEKNHKVAQAILSNQRNFKVDNLNVINADYNLVLDEILVYAPFDIVFLDPPFEQDILSNVLNWLAENAIMQKKSLILCEWGLQFPLVLPKMYVTKKLKRAGRVNFSLLEYDN